MAVANPMKILTKQYTVDIPENLTVEYIEDFIHQSGFSPLRWAITMIKDQKLTVDAVVVED